MKVAIYNGLYEPGVEVKDKYDTMLAEFRSAGCEVVEIGDDCSKLEGCDCLLSVGGDGTFLSASSMSLKSGIPVAGVNFGRVGFLSENRPENIVKALVSGDYEIEDAAVLSASFEGNVPAGAENFWPYAFNEFTVHRTGAAMLGVDVDIDGVSLPTYWADGLIVSTSSGSTAYSLSAGGPIVLPESRVLIINPIAPHNLNIRPLVVPNTATITLRIHSRDGKAVFTADTRSMEIVEGVLIKLNMAQFSLKRVRLNDSNFINALTEKLHWGEDVRNVKK